MTYNFYMKPGKLSQSQAGHQEIQSGSQGQQIVLSFHMSMTVLEIPLIAKRCKLKKKLTQALVWTSLS